MKDFFISFTGADKAWADWIAYTLHEAGYDFHYQGWHFGPGANFVAEMQTGAAHTEHTLAVLSPKYFESPACTAEWTAAFNRDKDGTKRLLLPVRVVDFDPPGMLGPRVYVDLHGIDEATAKQRLLDAIAWKPGPPAAKPAFPGAGPVTSAAAPPFPGTASPAVPTLPRIWNVPHRRNPNFTGREELLESLHASLTSGDYGALTQAMHGLGGVGKTQTAIEYAYRYASEYDAVLWVHAEDPAVLGSHFASLSGIIGLDDLADQPSRLAAVKGWLREHTCWLLIFDNARTLAEINPYLPLVGGGHVIITSRNPEWRMVASLLEVQQLTRDEAIAFLLKRTGADNADMNERNAAVALNEHLDGLAIALEQAAAFVETHGISLSDYLPLFEMYRERAFNSEPLLDYPWTLATVWSISIDAVRQVSPAAADLLILLSFFAPDNVPLELIRSGAKWLPDALAATACNELQLRGGIRALRQHSLVESQGDFISMHRVVQAVTRGSLSEEARRSWTTAAIMSVDAALPDDCQSLDVWPVYSRLASHASAVADHCAAQGLHLILAAYNLNNVGLYFLERADYEAARTRFAEALTLWRAASELDDVNIANLINNLGASQKELGDVKGAQQSLGQALQILETDLGPNHPNVAACLNNIGLLQSTLRDYAGAHASFERALSIDTAVFGENHQNVARDLHNLGGVQKAIGNLGGALSSHKRALQIAEAEFGSNHPKVALCLHALASVQNAVGDYSAARKNYERALRIREVVYGFSHPVVASTIGELGVVLSKLGESSNARENFNRALIIFRSAFGDEHPDTRAALNNLRMLATLLEQPSDGAVDSFS